MSVDETKQVQRIDNYILDFDKNDQNGFDQYQHLLQHMFHFEAELKQPFEASSRTYLLDKLVFASAMTNTGQTTHIRNQDLIDRSLWDYVLVLLYRNSPVQYKTDEGTFDVFPDQLLFVDLRKPISIISQGVNVLSLNIPLDYLNPLGLTIDKLHGTLLSAEPHASLLINYMKTLELVAEKISLKDVPRMLDIIIKMVTNCLLSAKQTQEVADESSEKVSNRVSLLQLKYAIDSQIDNPKLSIELLQTQFHLSRTTIYRLFEPIGGVMEYIQNQRLIFAYKELSRHSTKKHNISLLAYKLGFNYPSSFSRAFRAKFAINPKDVKTNKDNVSNQEYPFHLDIDLEAYKQNRS